MTDAAPRPATLNWGVKQSFRGYVEGSGGTIEAGAGATREADGTFVFTPDPQQALSLDAEGRPQGRASFLGELKFQAHGGMLSVFMADPALEVGEAGAFITVADTPSRTRRVPLAKLDLAKASRDTDGALVIPAVMAMEGWQVLGDHYMGGTPIDPVRLVLAS